jgi:biopolymer transport protein ExbD
MVRGYADLHERKLYEDAFRDLLPEERELALEQRRQHKTAVVLIHELGHTLGVGHDEAEDFIMSASYSIRAAKLSASSKDHMLAAINVRVGRSDARVPTPAAAPMPVAEPSGPLVFHISVDGSIKRGDKLVGDVDLDNFLNDAFARDPKTEVVIRRARKAPADSVEKIVSKATAVGLTRVSISLY